jgi:hypothetical protein
MCKTYNTIGSLTSLKQHLESNRIYDFKSLKEVINFRDSYELRRQQIISQNETLIEQERMTLSYDLQQLNTEIESQRLQSEKELKDEISLLKQQLNDSDVKTPKNFVQKIVKRIRVWNHKKKISHKEINFNNDVKKSISNLVNIQQIKTRRYEYIVSNFDDAVRKSCQQPLSELNRKKAVIDNLSNFIYGALGEQKVVKTLEALPDDYYLINDFAVSFSKAIYNRQENDYIKSIQIDHILVAPSGIFLIETKNWSEKSIKNLSLRSPIEQIKRTSFVLFRMLNNEMSNYHMGLRQHHWGNKKIAIRNLIVLTNVKPKEEFQYVKVLTLNELINYINYFKPIFSELETRSIAEYLINSNHRNYYDV